MPTYLTQRELEILITGPGNLDLYLPVMSSSHEHGVAYTLSNTQLAPFVDRDPIIGLKSLNIRYVRLTWLDYTSLIRYRVIP